ncbi:MAG: Spy/CpxP family protein refolding chaperone [Ferrovibrio sp.]|uniref:Spy/CpxP family protein refolding chaperone n=1 Tax=Ferrovibrio sp. TaxID=1917215 RepID=UPI002626D4C6|nr:Spy/CpxP family protein refolding chaperone [Ferrovibrio sp.]MCW0236144.1 Spy/CpxP family protein refolding chaperone [Ferrovibrio sp.]
MTRRLFATLAFGLTLAAGFALGTIGRSPANMPAQMADADIPTLPPLAAVIVPVNPQDTGDAERNLYPAPQTALQLADSLSLDEPQRQQLRQLQNDTEAEISALGRRLMAEERRLARAFAENNIEATRIDALTARIAALDGRIRALRLRSHLAARDALTPDQLLRFASLRGYQPAPEDERGDDPLR